MALRVAAKLEVDGIEAPQGQVVTVGDAVAVEVVAARLRDGERRFNDALRWFQTRSDADGRFVFQNLPPVNVKLVTGAARPMVNEQVVLIGRDSEHSVTLEVLIPDPEG